MSCGLQKYEHKWWCIPLFPGLGLNGGERGWVETEGSLNLRPAWFTRQVLRQPELLRETLSLKTTKQTSKKKRS